MDSQVFTFLEVLVELDRLRMKKESWVYEVWGILSQCGSATSGYLPVIDGLGRIVGPTEGTRGDSFADSNSESGFVHAAVLISRSPIKGEASTCDDSEEAEKTVKARVCRA